MSSLPKPLQRICFRCKIHIMWADNPVQVIAHGVIVKMHQSCKEKWLEEYTMQDLICHECGGYIHRDAMVEALNEEGESIFMHPHCYNEWAEKKAQEEVYA